jgi:hypothetical protein
MGRTNLYVCGKESICNMLCFALSWNANPLFENSEEFHWLIKINENTITMYLKNTVFWDVKPSYQNIQLLIPEDKFSSLTSTLEPSTSQSVSEKGCGMWNVCKRNTKANQTLVSSNTEVQCCTKSMFELIHYKMNVLEIWFRMLCRVNHKKGSVRCTFPRCWASIRQSRLRRASVPARNRTEYTRRALLLLCP